MSKEFLIIDPHGGHNSGSEVDDGSALPTQMVKAAKGKNIIPAITSHNTLKGVSEYLQAMESVGWKKVSLPGVEFSYQVSAMDLDGKEDYSEEQNFLIWVENDRAVYTESNEDLSPCREAYCKNDVWETKKHLAEVLTRENIIPFVDKLTVIPPYTWKDYIFPVKKERMMYESLLIGQGLQIALYDPGFASFYSRVYKHDIGSNIKRSPEEELHQISTAAHYYAYYRLSFEERGLNKGEVICLMPNRNSLIEKMAETAEEWRGKDYHKTKSLTHLFDFLDDKFTQTEFDDLVWHVPHPVSIDSTILGKLIVRLKEGRLKLFSPEIFLPEIAERIDTIEVYNASHPGPANGLAEKISHLSPLKGKGKVGSSDSHHPCWVGTGATLVEVDEVSTDGILQAMKEGQTIPLKGWGSLSDTWLPFFAWMSTVTLGKKKWFPQQILNQIYDFTDVQTPADEIIASKCSDRSLVRAESI